MLSLVLDQLMEKLNQIVRRQMFLQQISADDMVVPIQKVEVLEYRGPEELKKIPTNV